MTETAKRAPERNLEDVSTAVLRSAVKAATDNDLSNFELTTGVAFMMLDSLSKAIKRGESIEDKHAKKRINDVWYTFCVKSVYAGIQVYLGTAPDVARVKGMPVKIEDKPSDKLRAARQASAREHVNGKWVLNGEMLPVEVDPTKDTSGRFIGAVRKQHVSSYSLAHKLAPWIVNDIRANSPDVIRDLDGRKLTTDDLESFRAMVREVYGATFADLEHSYKSGKPKKEGETDAVKRIQNAAEKLKLEELERLSAWVAARVEELRASAADAEESVPDLEEELEIGIAA